MYSTPELIEEMDVLLQFDLSSTQQGIKVHSTADGTTLAAAKRLYHKGLISLPDGGYLTDIGRKAAEHTEQALSILTTDVVITD